MKTNKFYAFVLIALTLFTGNLYAQEAQDSIPSREKMELQTMTGTVKAINAETREITLMGEDGELTTITAGEEVERFSEIAVGDAITFDVYTFLKAEFREPTAEEIAEPVVIVAEAAKATMEDAPAGAVGAVMKAVVTIEVLDRVHMLATVQGPGGNYLTIQMEDKDLITKLHIGQVVILTYAEAIAVSLEKLEK
jgi:Cu/Ag efflux protein CusF